MNFDAVFWGSMATIAIATIIVVFLVFKIKALIKKDADAHK